MPPRYIAVPFTGGGTVLPIPTPTLTVTPVSGSQINASIGYTGPPGAITFAFEKASNVNGPFVPLASGTSSTFSDVGLPPGTTYFYRAKVQVTDGRFSDYSSIKSASTLASVPQSPTNLTATDIDQQSIQLAWNAPAGTLTFADDYNAAPVGDVALTSYWTTKGYSDFENSGTTSNVTIVPRASLPSALLSNPNFSTNPNKQVLKFTLAANEIQARLLWSNFPAGTRTTSVSWWEYRDTGNLGGEKFCRVGNFVSGPGSNRGVDSIVTLGQVTGTTLVANSANMHAYGDHSLSPGISGIQGLHHFEAVYTLSNGVSADGSVALYQDGTLVGQATGLQFFDTTAQAAIGLQLWDMGGWSSTGGGTEGVVTYPITRYFCEVRVAPSRQGVWAMSSPANSLTYNVYRNSASVVSGLSSLTYIDTGLTSNTLYTYQVSATNGSGEGPLSSPATATTAPIIVGTKKWFPGWYMGSDAILTNGRLWTDSHFTQELSDMRSSPSSVVGYRMFITMSHIDPNNANGVIANYHWADIDGAMANIAPKKFAIQFNMGVFNNPTPARPSNNDFSTVPQYILQNTGTYGTGFPSGDPNGQGGYYEQNTGGYCANITNTAVRTKIIQIINAVAQRYDNNPQFAYFGICEDSNMIPLSGSGVSNFRTSWMAIYQAAASAFVNTPVYAQATFQITAAESETVCDDMVTRGVLQGTADTYGAGFYGLTQPYKNLSWGLAAYTGTPFAGITAVTDRRSLSGAVVDYQDSAPDLSRSTSIADLASSLNNVLKANVCFFSHVSGKTGTQTYANWPNAVTQFAPNPITTIAYPQNL